MNLPRLSPRIAAQRLWSLEGQGGNELRYVATVSIWLRWICLGAVLVESSYRIEYGAPSHVLNTMYLFGMMAANGYVWWRIRASGRVSPPSLLALSAIDVAGFSFTLSMSGGFDSRYLPLYFLPISLFAWVFTSPYLVFSWTTMVAVVYVSVCLVAGDGIDFGEQEEKELFYRVMAMFAVAMSVNLITRFERVRRLRAVERERELSRQRIEISQAIHDTSAQSAFMLALGLQDAMEKAEGTSSELAGKLEALWALSRTTMWTLRQPIDGGDIFSGGKLSEVLAAHVDTFTVITSIPAEFVQHGDEPELSTVTRSLLFSIAHNALTNAFRHSGAENVAVCLDFREDRLLMSVFDDGVGLPEDYEARGHGFRNMQADADRIGGRLEVDSNGKGTTVSCTVPYEQNRGGQ